MVDASKIDALFHGSPNLVWLAGNGYDCLYGNAALQRLTGLDSNQIHQLDWRNLLLEEDRAVATACWQRSVAVGAPYHSRVRIRKRNGAGVPIDLQAFRHRADDEAEIWLFSGLRLQSAAREQPLEWQIQATLNLVPAHTWYAGPSGGLTFVNRRCADYLGLPAESPLRSGIHTQAAWDSHIPLLHPDDREETRRVWANCLATGCAGEVSFRVRNAESQYRWFLSRAEPLMLDDGTLLYWIGINLDIDERKQADLYLAEGQRLSHTGSWALNASGFQYWSSQLFEIHGLRAEGSPPSLQEYMALAHPEDRDFIARAIHKMMSNRLGFDFTKRIVRADGATRHVRCVGIPAPNGDGFVGTEIDVTEQEQLTKALLKSETELRQILDLTPQLVAVFGPRRERLYINRVALDYLGMMLEEWRENPPNTEIHSDDSEVLKSLWSRAMLTGAPFELEVRVRNRDGIHRWFLARYNPVRGEEGQVLRWYVACTDIDDRKRDEERLQQENAALRQEIDEASMFEEIVGASPALKAVLARISKVAPSNSTVLITGETGTGKELVARAIHRRSARVSRPFISVNCAAIAPDLTASELFGHEKGAFTGATHRRLGRFELADGGTMFLDEVGELSLDAQTALLRVLQERELERLGGGRPIQIDVRVIAATNRDLREAVSGGAFRQDLYYRLNVFPIEVPALRERRSDIPMLVEYFAQRYAKRAGKNIRSIDKRTLELFHCYDWPGNIRELQNVIERSVILTAGDVLAADPSWFSRETLGLASQVSAIPATDNDQPWNERAIIETALAQARGRVSGASGAAARLKISASTLERRIRILKINKHRFKFS